MTRRRALLPLLASVSLALAVAGCTTQDAAVSNSEETAVAAETASDAGTVWDSSVLHTVDVEYDQADYDSLMSAYADSGDKVWISATVTIDGATYEDVGLKLKGNSSLRGAGSDSDPASLPWIIRLDKYVDGQNHQGSTEFVIRGNTSATSLNEALALDLLDATGLAAQEAVATSFSVEGGDATLRLMVENPDDAWMERELGDGLLYKAEAGGDYSYRGTDTAAYEGVFDQEGGDTDLEPLIGFLDFVNNADDATFAAQLSDHLDVEAFATYLAFQGLIDNADDIDGPGNNSYLYYDPGTGLMTVVNWDLNLAFGATPGAGGGTMGDAPAGRDGRTMQGPGAPPGDDQGATDGGTAAGDMPAGGMPAGGQARGGGPQGSNVLAERFLADPDLAALVDAETERLTALLFGSGLASDDLETWALLLTDQASALVPAATVEEEASALEARLPF